MSYVQYGPFTNAAAPYVSAAFLNALETFLLSLNSASYDANITSDGAGNLNIPSTAHYNIGGINVMWSPSGQDLILNAPNAGGGHKLKLAVGGTIVMSIPSNGNAVFLGTVTQSGTP